jgi:hypothetical protein
MTDDVRMPRIDRGVMRRAVRLLEMPYKPSELADALGVSVQTIYQSHLPAGCPHRRDDDGHIWIVGSEWRAWAEEMAEKSKHRQEKEPLDPDEAFCLHCRKRTKMVDLNIGAEIHRNLVQLTGKCQFCGGVVSRLCSNKGGNR